MKAVRKEFCREITHSFSRFISILLIVALGVAFYAGIRSTKPDMELSADKYFDDTNLADIRLISTIGTYDKNIEDIKSLDCVESAEGIKYADYISYYDGKSNVVKVMSLCEEVGKISLVEGRLPKEEDECVVDKRYIKGKSFKIGDKITIENSDVNDASQSLKQNEYTITGIFNSSYYFGLDRGTSLIGNGKVNGIVVVKKETFISEMYSEIYVSLKDTKDLKTYDDEYMDKINESKGNIEKIFAKSMDEISKMIDRLTEDETGSLRHEEYVLDRNSIQTYVEYKGDTERIGNIGKVFPVVFFIVAAFVALTTMTRMVEEERTQIGTFLALGYSKWSIAKKYIGYALIATLSGGVIGGIIGSKVLPTVILNAYGIMYDLPVKVTPVDKIYFASAVIIAVLCIVLSTVFAIYKVLMSGPAELMRPVPPKNGKRVFLERVGCVWRRLGFFRKSTIRNLTRYKKRLFMTIFGISGCMALLLVGFGLKDSINSIIGIQYDELKLYDTLVSTDGNAQLEKVEGVKSMINVMESACSFTNGEDTYTGYIAVFEDENVDEFMVFRDRENHERYHLNEDGIILAEKTANKLGVKAGDTITVKFSETSMYTVKISNVCENYVYHYAYMNKTYYEKIFGQVVYNEAFIKLEDVSDEENIMSAYLKTEGVTGVSYVDKLKDKFADMLGSLDIITVVLIISAGGLAIVVLYNLGNININERVRELATFKVLGFYDNEVSSYINRENRIIALIGTAIGIFVGRLLHQFVILTAEVDIVMFGRKIMIPSYVYSIIITILFSELINILMHFKMKKIDMTTSLKSVE